MSPTASSAPRTPSTTRPCSGSSNAAAPTAYIYPSTYTGQYCVNDELYVNDAQPGDPCPDCGRPTETVTEENYFFKLSAFQDRLLELYETQPQWIQPEYRKNEIVSFVKGGLRDLSITRTNLTWGIPVPVDGQHVFYVWFDALISYLTAVREDGLWPADLHLIGKDILRFHAIYWPAFLMAADLPLPKKVVAHGWILKDSIKMSKSRGNVVRPEPLAPDHRRRPITFLSVTGNPVWPGRQLQLRRVGDSHKRRSGQRPRQPGQPDFDDDPAVSRTVKVPASSRQRGDRRKRAKKRSKTTAKRSKTTSFIAVWSNFGA